MGLATSGWRQTVGVDALGVSMAWKRAKKSFIFHLSLPSLVLLSVQSVLGCF